MESTIVYIKSGNYFKVVNRGIYFPGDSLRLYRNIFSNQLWTPGSPILIDNRLVDYRNVNYSVMSRVSHTLTDYEIIIGNSRIGYLVDSQVGFGICRQFQMLMEGKTSTKIEVFTDETQAVDWLTQIQVA
jgi:hypothetical protein